MKLLCDEMLRGLGRWLRAAGHDTAIAEPGTADPALLAAAHRDGRLLLTRDRQLADHARIQVAVLPVAVDALDAQAVLLRTALGLDWLFSPFSRCMLDNALLVAAGADDRPRVPPVARDRGDPLHRCPCCQRVYWPGSHVDRMMARLEGWRNGGSGARSGVSG